VALTPVKDLQQLSIWAHFFLALRPKKKLLDFSLAILNL